MRSKSKILCALPLALLVGCSNMTPAEQSVLSGSALGALGGAAMGSLSGHAGEGALIGTALGGVAGAMADTNNRARDQRYENRRPRHAHPRVKERHYHYEDEEYDDEYDEVYEHHHHYHHY